MKQEKGERKTISISEIKNLDKEQQESAFRQLTGQSMGGMAVLMTVFLLVWFFRDPSNFVYRIGFNETALEIPLAWALALVVAVAYIAYTAFGVSTVREHIFDFKLSPLKILSIFAAFATGIFEEAILRHVFMDWLYSHNISVVLQVALSGLLFGLIHGTWALFGRSLKMGVGAALSTGVLGTLLAIVYIVAGRNVLPAIMAHILVNLFIEPWMVLHAIKMPYMSKRQIEPPLYRRGSI